MFTWTWKHERKWGCSCYDFTQTAKLALCQGRSKFSLILTSKLQRDLKKKKERESKEKIKQSREKWNDATKEQEQKVNI